MSRSREMSSHHMAQLLDAVMHHLPLDVRNQVMREVPAAYNAWCGREVMVTVRAEEVEAPKERCEACGGPMHVPTWGCVRPTQQ